MEDRLSVVGFMAFKSGKLTSAAPASMPASAFVKEDKWKLASQLQKAIRHGHAEHAQQAARDLWQVEPAYLRYRMSVIAVEDVAAGTPEAVLDAFSGGWRKAEVDARGGLDFLVEVAGNFTAAVKDRTPCDLMYATRFKSDFETLHGPWSDLSWESASELALDAAQPWWARALSAWRCAGTDKFQARTAILPTVAGDWDRWVAINGEAFGSTAAQLMRIGENQREHHHVFLGLALDAQRAPSAGVRTPPLPRLPDIGPWLSAALDKHTSEGRKALSRLPSMAPEGSARLAAAGVSLDDQPDLIGRMWFWMEGSRCDHERVHPMALAIRQDNQARTLGAVPPAVLIEAFGDPQLWQRARQAALGLRPSAPRP